MPSSRKVLSLVPTLSIALRLTFSGVRRIRRLPTAMTGDAAGRTSAATASPTPTATAALSTPMTGPSRARDLTYPCSRETARQVLTVGERSGPRSGGLVNRRTSGGVALCGSDARREGVGLAVQHRDRAAGQGRVGVVQLGRVAHPVVELPLAVGIPHVGV